MPIDLLQKSGRRRGSSVFTIVDSSNEIETQAEPGSAVAVALGQNAKDLEARDDVLLAPGDGRDRLQNPVQPPEDGERVAGVDGLSVNIAGPRLPRGVEEGNVKFDGKSFRGKVLPRETVEEGRDGGGCGSVH